MSTIQLSSAVPGPKSRALWGRRERAVARGISTAHPLFIEKTSGCAVTDVDGNTFIDFTGGIGALNVGHTHPAVVKAAQEQAARFTHTASQVLFYEPYLKVAEELCRLAPLSGDKRAFLVTTGTEAVENAVKVARAFTRRPAVICFEHAFHGRSLGGLSLTSRYKPYKAGFGPFLPEVHRLPYPYPYREGVTPAESLARFKAALASAFQTVVAPDQVAALLVESVLGEGGFLVPVPGFLEHLREVTAREGILLVVDEVQAGFGRTGKWFGVQHFGVEPDLVCVAKSLAAGFPLSGLVGRADVMDAVGPGALGGTYGGNPVACAAAVEAIRVIEREGLLEKSAALGRALDQRLRAMAARRPWIGEVRGLGAMQAIELVTDRNARTPATAETQAVVAAARERGLLLLSCGTSSNVIRFLMPLSIEPEVLDEGLAVLDQVLDR